MVERQNAIRATEFANDREIYERQPNEKDTHWKGFVIYRDLGLERTINKASLIWDPEGETHGIKNPTSKVSYQMYKWASRWNWRDRVVEWDRELDKIKRRKVIEEVEKMRMRHIQLSTSIQAVVEQELKKWLKTAQENPDVQTTLGAIVNALDSATKLERTSRGEPETIQEQRQLLSIHDQRQSMRNILMDEEALDAIDIAIERSNLLESDNGNSQS